MRLNLISTCAKVIEHFYYQSDCFYSVYFLNMHRYLALYDLKTFALLHEKSLSLKKSKPYFSRQPEPVLHTLQKFRLSLYPSIPFQASQNQKDCLCVPTNLQNKKNVKRFLCTDLQSLSLLFSLKKLEHRV
jgi:hypothetical protein